MPQVAGQASSYDLPQYIGELFRKGKRPNAFLRAIGGLTGGIRLVKSRKFPLNVDYQLAAPAQPAILEGVAPVKSSEQLTQASNITQIFQYGVEHTYTAQAIADEISGIAVIPGAGQQLHRPGSLEFQIDRKLEKAQDDLNLSIIQGTYQEPVDNTTARRMRGIRNAITTNIHDAAATGGDPIADRAEFEAILGTWLGTGRMAMSGDDIWVFADVTELGWLMSLYETAQMSQPPASTTIAGVMIRQINARWFRLNLVEDPDVPAQALLFAQPSVCRITALPIPNKGILFVEPLSKAGSSDTLQLYGELGLDYGAEWLHGLIHGRGAA